MGEFQVHHVRFFEWKPKAIQCMAYKKENERLALLRFDGSIELWSVKDHWYQEEMIPAGDGQSIEGLVWQCDRLFSVGFNGNVNEIDLVRLCVKTSCSSNAGPVWCITSNSSCNKLAVGTEEGCVVLFDTENNNLEYLCRFESQESRILCISWHATEDVIVTGGIDNIRLWSVSSGRAMQRLTLTRQDRNKETVVWCVAILSDMTIVSGDSRGKTTFWNGKQGTVIKSIQSHEADVYCLAVDSTETSVVTSGVDSSVIQFQFIAARENSDWKDWVATFVHKHHTHDVRAVQIVNRAIVTGGVDTDMIHFDLKQRDAILKETNNMNESGSKLKKWKRIPAIPHKSMVKVAELSNILLLQYTNYLEIWRLGYTDTNGVSGDILPVRSNPIQLIQLKTEGGTPVFCCNISHDASLVAYSDGVTVHLCRISIENIEGIQPDVSMSRISVHPRKTPDGAHCMCFTSAEAARLVTVTSSSQLQISTIKADTLTVEHTFSRLSESYHLLAVSADDTYAAVADHACCVHIYNLQTLQHACNVPRYSCQVTALTFSPNCETLAMAYSDQKILEFDFLKEEYTEWTKQYSHKFMKCWLRRKSKISNIKYNPSNSDQIVINDEQMFCILDKKQPFPKNMPWQTLCTPNPEKPSAFHICNKYKFLLHLEVLKDNWLIVVERPPLDLTRALPDALKKKKFGT